MVREHVATGAGVLLALMLTAGLAAAQGPIALVTGDGGAQGQGEAQGSYHADATGALDEADDGQADLKDQAEGQWDAANENYVEARAGTWSNVNETDMPQRPQCECGEQAIGQVEQVGQVQASHADEVHKAADLESEHVDAGADLRAAGQADAWYEDAFQGLKDTFAGLKDALDFQTDADEDAKDEAATLVRTDDELRAQLDTAVKQDADLPDADPQLEGELGAQHATELTSQAAGDGQAEVGP